MMIFLSFISGISLAFEFDFESNLAILDLAILRIVFYYGNDPDKDLA